MKPGSSLIIGVDGGGTHCRAKLFDDNGNSLYEAMSGPANVARDFRTTTESIISAVEDVLVQSGVKATEANANTKVFAGLAGAQVTSAANKLAAWKHPFAEFHAVTDLHATIMGAHQGNNGAALIIGTGSSAAALVDGQVIQFGGHGFLLGDCGSGAWLGLQAVQKTLLALDGVTSAVESTFTLPVINALGVETTNDIVSKMIGNPPANFAALAPLVIELAENEEPTARSIVQQGGDYLSALAEQALNASGGKICLNGGLSQRLLPWLNNHVQAKVVAPSYCPEWGAVLACQAR